jgi:hypothetical protein
MNKISFFALGLASVALVSCSSDEPKNSGEATPITLRSNVEQTRSANVNLQKTQIANGVQVGVFARTATDYIASGNNAKMTADGNGAFSGTTLYYPTDGSAVSVYAYAPYSTDFDGKYDVAVPFSVAADQSSDAGYLASDLLCGAPTGSNAFTKDTPTVNLNFSHKLAKIIVNFDIEDGAGVDLKGATVNVVNTLPTTSLNVADGSISAASGSATTIKAVTFSNEATEFAASAVIVPQTVAAGSFVQIILADKMLNAKLNSAVTFEAGKSYTYNVYVGSNRVEFETTTTVTDWITNDDVLSGDVSQEELPEVTWSPSSFVAPTANQSCTYENGVYSWTSNRNNLMTILEFSNGELAQYKYLDVTISDLEGAPWRMGYTVDGTWTSFGSSYYSAGKKTVDLNALSETVDLSKVTSISLGGDSSEGHFTILPSDVVLRTTYGSNPTTPGSGNSSDDNTSTPSADGKLYATFSSVGSGATYVAPTYTWTAGSNNLMTMFEFSNGELAEYKTLTLTFSNLGSEQSVRVGVYVDGAWTEVNSGFYSNGTKTIALSDLEAKGIDLSKVDKICFGGRNPDNGSCDIKASEVYLSK